MVNIKQILKIIIIESITPTLLYSFSIGRFSYRS